MKLTIKNYNKIVNEWSNIVIRDVIETDKDYRFNCRYPGSSLDYWVTLSRHRMNTHGGIWAFPFIGSDGEQTQGVTGDWFADIDNAVGVIGQEFERVWNEHNP